MDLYKLFRFVQKLGGTQRVTNNNQWRIVAKKLGFETNWCVNQVKVIYRRYLHSFEELYRTLGCTLINHPRNSRADRSRHGSGRPLMRGVRTGSKVKEEDGSDKSSVSSQEGGDLLVKKEDVCDEIDLDGDKQKSEPEEKRKIPQIIETKIIKDEALDEETEIFDASKKGKDIKGKKGKEERMLTRPRRDSSSSLAAATELKAKKDEIGESSKPRKEVKKEKKIIKEEDDKSDSGSTGSKSSKPQRKLKKKEEEPVDQEEECNSDLDNVTKKKKPQKKKSTKTTELAPVKASTGQEGEEPQHLKPSVECSLGDKIKVFWLHGQIYEAKIIKVDKPGGGRWPRYYVHYQGWNQRYDEWITRGRIAENLTWNANPKKTTGKSHSPPPEKSKGKTEKLEKRSSDEDEKRDSDEKVGSEEDKELEMRRKTKSVRSSTPSSTPGSSRTSSPAHSRRNKSPVTRRPGSPKEKTPNKDKKSLLPRTNSPAHRKSPVLKRQSSRNSLNKQTDDEDMEVSDHEEQEEKLKKPPKPEKEANDSKTETHKRSVKSTSVSKLETKPKKGLDSEKEEERKPEHSKTTMRSRRSATPTKKVKNSSDNDSDPYVFQEPEPMEIKNMSVKIENISAADIAKHSKSDSKENKSKFRDVKEVTAEITKDDSTDSDNVKIEIIKEENQEEEVIEEEVKTDIKECKDEKSDEKKVVSDRHVNLFPHLASLSSGPVASLGLEGSCPGPEDAKTQESKVPDTEAIEKPADEDAEITTLEITSDKLITSIVESSILKETMDVPVPATFDSNESVDLVPVLNSKDDSKDDGSNEPNPPKQRTRKKKSTKLRNLRNPSHISREVVTDSDSDSEEEKIKPKPVTPRRKAAEAEKNKTPKRLKEVDSEDDVSAQVSKKTRKRKDDEDDSLVCEETLPGSPVQPCSTDLSSTGAREERNASSRVELPFASVATSGGPDTGAKSLVFSAVQASLKSVESPPATPDSANSLESHSPMTRSRKEDGRKSPAESSEVDLESLSGRGKAGSEDSRMDVECSSSSDNRRPGRRRTAAPKETEKEEEKPFQSSKKKRKTRGDSSGRGRGNKGRGRNSSGMGRGVGRNVEESDDSGQDGKVIDEQKLERLDNAALADLAKPRPNSTSKYNFYVTLSKY